MSSILQGKCLTWVTFDPDLSFSAAMRSMMIVQFAGQPVRVQVDVAQSLEESAQWVCHRQSSLLTIVVDDAAALAAAKCLWQCRQRSQTTLRIAISRTSSREFVALLAEAGAQIVVSEVPSLQRMLPQILERIQLKAAGFHPLTSGLMDRLPWRKVDT